MSLRTRLLVATGIAMLCGLVIVDGTTFLLVTRSQLEQVDAGLARAHSPTEQLAATGDPDSWAVIPEVAPGLYVAIVDGTGAARFTVAAREPGQPPITIDVATVELQERSQTVRGSNGEEMRLRVDRLGDDSNLIVGQPLYEVNEARRRLLVVLLAASGAAIAAVLAVAWWLVRVGLSPLRAVEASAAAITDQALSDQRVPGADRPTEVGSLARGLNAMLDRLDVAREDRERTVAELRASEARMRQFVADASHELRTPMAATAAYAELFEKGARDHPADLERAMTGIRSETARMSGLVDDLLLLAQLDERRPMLHEEVDLTEVVLAAVDAARTVEPERPIRTRIDGVHTVEGDPARLRQVVDNLLANVRTHTPVDAECDVHLTTEAEYVLLEISDTGPGVVDGQLERLSDRFYRVDDARTRTTGGSGLGLSIAYAIVAAHGGSLTPEHNDPRGLKLSVRLPKARKLLPVAEPETAGDAA